ncbi:ABC transporter permease [Nitriliruptor alkaliphilus]|uniref:ABC transporter permease n=1 Tax=Nitriliruptor alkaliphilus TaxID=427918 RepID=UPI0009FAC42D|nr:ABC transporter permease [Nitriliruptor alkaliphilus]
MSHQTIATGRRGTPVSDAITIFIRQSLPQLREPWGLGFGMLQPLVFLAFFGPLLGGVVDAPGMAGTEGSDPWLWFVPAVLVMLALFGTAGTGYMMLTEMQTGSHERLLVTPINRTSMLAGRTLGDVATLVAQGVLIIVVMLPFGLRPHPLGVVIALALLALLGLAFGAMSHALAIALRAQQEAFYMVQSSVTFPLLFLSGLMLPLEMGPGWMQTIGRLNPLTYVVEAQRALFAGDLTEGVVLQGTVSVVALAVVGLVLGTRAMRRAHS